MTYRDNAGRKGKVTDQSLFDYYTDIHPRTESQFNDQQFLAGIFSNYDAWMKGRSTTERNMKTRELYSVAFEDITYPWLSGLTAADEYSALGSGAWEFSQNINRLYASVKRYSDKSLKRRTAPRRRRYYRNYRW